MQWTRPRSIWLQKRSMPCIAYRKRDSFILWNSESRSLTRADQMQCWGGHSDNWGKAFIHYWRENTLNSYNAIVSAVWKIERRAEQHGPEYWRVFKVHHRMANLPSQSVAFFRTCTALAGWQWQGNGLRWKFLKPALNRKPRIFRFHLLIRVERLPWSRRAYSGGTAVIKRWAQLCREEMYERRLGTIRLVYKIYDAVIQELLDPVQKSGKRFTDGADEVLRTVPTIRTRRQSLTSQNQTRCILTIWDSF